MLFLISKLVFVATDGNICSREADGIADPA